MTSQLNNRLFWVLAGMSFFAMIANLPNLVNEIDQKLDQWISQAMVYQEYDSSAISSARGPALEMVSKSAPRTGPDTPGSSGLRDQVAADQIMRLFVILKAEGQSPNSSALGAVLLQ